MRGSASDLSTILDSPNVNIRNQGMLYAAYNPAVAQYLSTCGASERLTMVCGYLNQQKSKQEELEHIGNEVPMSGRGIAFSVLGGVLEFTIWAADDIPDVSPGLRMWLADRIDDLAGQTVDEEERHLDNSPKPVAKQR